MYCSRITQQCSYTHVFPSVPSVSQFDMQVTASNFVGEGPSVSYIISKYEFNGVRFLSVIVFKYTGSANAFATLYVVSITAPWQARVLFLDVFSDPQNCSFKFGTDDTYMTLPRNAARNITSNNTEMIFDLGNLNTSTYYYNMSCDVISDGTTFSLVMQGMFQSSEFNILYKLYFMQLCETG